MKFETERGERQTDVKTETNKEIQIETEKNERKIERDSDKERK